MLTGNSGFSTDIYGFGLSFGVGMSPLGNIAHQAGGVLLSLTLKPDLVVLIIHAAMVVMCMLRFDVHAWG